MNRAVVGVIGHVDHGKTALVRALTGQDTDRLPEEKARGISIALGFAHLQTGADAIVDLIDMPGHERFVRTMVSGATGIDAVMLVVAANEGVKPQTVEHVEIAALLGIERAVVAISKTDLVTAEQARQVVDQAAALLARSGLAASAAVMTSSLNGTGFEDLRTALGKLAENRKPRATDRLTFLPIDRAFSVKGHGPVVTGTLRGAAIATGDKLQLLPSRKPVRVRSVQVHGAKVTSASSGQRVALNLRGVEITDLDRGMALAAPDALALTDWLTMTIRAIEGAPPLKNGMRLRALSGTDEVEGRLRLLDRDVLERGETGFAQLRTARPVALPVGEHIILRRASPAETVAGGRLLDSGQFRLKRHAAPVLMRLTALRDGHPAETVAKTIIRKPVLKPRLELDTARMAEIAETLRLGGLTPSKIPTDPPSQRAIDRLLRDGIIIRAVDRDKRKEILFHRDAIAAAKVTLKSHLNPPGLLVSEITQHIDISRKYAMPLLDHLDTIRFTRRIGDRRIRHPSGR